MNDFWLGRTNSLIHFNSERIDSLNKPSETDEETISDMNHYNGLGTVVTF
jgi:hypothetical protein